MSLTTVNRSSVADVKLTLPGGSLKSYKAQFNRFGMRAVTPEIDITTFAGEVNGETDQGATRYIVTYAGITKTGIDGSNGEAVHADLLTNPPNVASTYQWATGATLAGTFNYNDHSIERIAGTVSVFAGAGVSNGTVTIAWPES